MKLITFFILGFSSLSFGQGYWRLTQDFPGGAKTSLAGIRDTVLFTSTGQGIWRSQHAGQSGSWQHILKTEAIYSLRAEENGRILAGGTGKIYFSVDFGNSWDSVALNSPYQVRHILRNSSGAYFASTGTVDPERGFIGDGVFYSNGTLNNWQKRNQGIIAGSPFCDFLAIDKYDRLYLGVTNEFKSQQLGLFISDNEGQDWQLVPVVIDGKGTIENNITIEQTHAISISPQDSVYISFSGAAGLAGVRLNIIKHRNDLLSQKTWNIMQVFPSVSWWLDRLLSRIYFARNGTYFSSIIGSTAIGGTMISEDNGKNWNRITDGLGLSEFGNYTEQLFYESSFGKIYMVQAIDERVYWTEKSIVAPKVIRGKVVTSDGTDLAGVLLSAGTIGFRLSDFSGNFELVVHEGWSGKITPELINHTFTPASVTINNISDDLTGVNFMANTRKKYFISGTVTDVFDQKASGVEIAGFSFPLFTNDAGMFYIELDSAWSGTIQPTHPSLTFSPEKIIISGLKENLTDQNFQYRPVNTWLIKGKILDEKNEPLSTVTLSGLGREWKINQEGNYTAVVPENWTGTIKPQLTNYKFTPDSLNFNNLSSDLFDQDFIAELIKYTISGVVLNANGYPIQNVEIKGFPEILFTDLAGKYESSLVSSWTGNIEPFHPSYNFTPEKISVENLSQSLEDQNFTGELISNTDDDLNNNDIIIYPNPSSNGYFIISSRGGNKIIGVQVFTFTGQEMKDINTTKNGNNHEIKIKQPGVFLAKIVSEEDSYFHKVVVE